MQRSKSIDILLVNQHAEEIKHATISFREFFPDCHVETVYRIEDAHYWAQQTPWRLILIDEQLIKHHTTSILPEIKRLAPSATLILQSERDEPTVALDALHAGADFFLHKKSPTFLAELMLYAKDVFEKQDTRNAFEQLHSRHNQLIESLTDVLYELDSEGRFVYVSPSVTKMLGYPPEELVGTPYSTVIASDQLDRARHRFDDRRTGTRASQNIPIELTPKSHPQQPNPTRIKAEITAKGIYNSQRQHLGTRGLLRDISNQREQEETIRRLTHQLQQTDQLVAAGQRLASLSKELESPQSNILIQSQELLDTIRNLRLIERVENLARYAEQASRLRETITHAAIGSDIRRQTINGIIESVLASIHPTLIDESRIERVYAKTLPSFTGQYEIIIQLMRILLSQALRYMTVAPTHHRIRISTGAISAEDLKLTPTTSPSPSIVPVDVEILIEQTDETVVNTEAPVPEIGDLFEAYALLKQLRGGLDFHAPSSGRLSIKIRIPVEQAPPGTTPSNTPLSQQAQPTTITEAALVVNPFPASSLPDRRNSPRILVHYPAHITIGDSTHVGTMTSLGRGGMDLLMDTMPTSIENQQAYALLQTNDGIVEFQAVAHNRSVGLNESTSEPGRSRIALRISPPINDNDQTVLSMILTKAQARTLSMTVEILLTSETLPRPTPHVMTDATRDRDHRETVRVRVRLPVHVHAVSSRTLAQNSVGIVTNLSRRGACLHLDQIPGKPGDHVTLSLPIPNQLNQIQSQKRQAQEMMLSARIIWAADELAVDAGSTSESPKPHRSTGVCLFPLPDADEQEMNHILAQHIISSMNIERIPDQSSFVHASWECRNDRHQVIAVTDTHLRRQTSSNSPIVIIVPGYGRTQTDYLPLACYLGANHFRVLRYDHTNHLGLSDGKIEDTSLSNMQTDLQSLLLFARTTWPTVDITLVAEDVGARVALKTMARSCTADRLLLVDPVLDLGAALLSTYGQDVVADFHRGLRRGVTNLWGLNVNLDSFISDAIAGQYSDWKTAAADFTAVSPTPIILTTPERFRTTNKLSFSTETGSALDTSPVITLLGPISSQSALDDRHQFKVFHSVVQYISSNIQGPFPQNLMHTLPQYSISHRLLAEKERIRIRHHISHADRNILHRAYLTQLPQLQQMPPYGMVPTELHQQLLPITPGMTILDVGCEHSAFARVLVTNHTYAALYRGWATDTPIHYIGLSQSQDGLATAQQQLYTFMNQFFSSVSSEVSAAHCIRTTWLANDWSTSLPFDNHSIDRILFQLCLPFTRSPLQCLREALRILRPNGSIVATCFRPHTDLTPLVRHQIHAMKQDEFSPQAQSVLLLLGRLHEAIRHGIIHSYEPDDFESLCIQAGGRPLQILPIVDNQLLLAIITKNETQ